MDERGQDAAHRAAVPAGASSADRERRLALLTVGVALTAVVAWPLVQLVAAAVDRGWSGVSAAFHGVGAWTAVANTCWLAAVVTPLALVIGTTAALVTERLGVVAPRAVRGGLLLALIVPPFVTAESWARAYGPGGFLDHLLGWSLPGTYGPLGVLVVLVIDAVPLVWLLVAAGLASRAEPDLERAARAAGAGRLVALRTVTLPLLRPALIAAGALTFVLTINAFGAPAVLGLPGGFVTMTTRIYRDLNLSADPAAFNRVVVLATGLVLLAAATVGLADLRGGARQAALRSAAPGGSPAPGRASSLGAAALWAYVAVTVAVPLIALVLTALTRGIGLPPVPANWTLANLRQALSSHTLEALGNSAVLAVTAATVVLLLGGLLTAVRRTRSGASLGTAAVLTFAVPGSTLAVAMLLAYGSWLRDTLALILLAYVAKFWALGHRALAGAADTVPRETAWAARAGGASRAESLLTVVAPAVAPAVGAAWVLVVLAGMHELTMSSLLYGPGTRTLAVAVLNAEQLGDDTVTASLAVLLTLLLLVVSLPLALIGRRRRRGA